MAGLSILGTGSYLPELTLTNEMLEKIVVTSDEWIVTRTGIKERAIAADGETAQNMATAAAKRAIEDARIDLSDIGIIICATVTGDYITPSLACLLQRGLGIAEDVFVMDINCACAGFNYAIKTAHSLLADKPEKAALVLGCEMLSRVTDYTDRATCILFGDGAGAVVLKRTQQGEAYFDGGSKGNDEMLFFKPQYICNSPFADRGDCAKATGIYMNGPEVFRFALETVPQSVNSLMRRAGVALDDIDHFVFHQANGRIIDGIARRMKIPLEKCVVNIHRTGNTSSASVAIALDELNKSGKLKRGDKLVMSAFGGGLTYGSLYFEW